MNVATNRFVGVLACLTVLAAQDLAAQAPSSAEVMRKLATAVRVDNGSIRVDGTLDDAGWARANTVTDLVQKEPIEGAPPSEQTEIRFVYDDTALYVGARMFKRSGSAVQAPMGRRDRGEQVEYLHIALDTFLDHRTAYVFGVTAGGVRIDRFHSSDSETAFDEGYDPVWEARTAVTSDGWTAELWIPFSQLRFNQQAEQAWGLNIHRFTPTLNEDDYWAPVPRTITAWSSRFGELLGIDLGKSPRRIEALPYVAGSSIVTSNRNPANPFDDGRNLTGRVGADLKVGLGPNLTLDATINPDFGQVEADPAEVNLSAFETIFAEKRPFFLEGATLLELASVDNFFYSRRVGARPAGAATGEFVDYPQTTTILGAAKLTGRLASGTSIGMLSAVTAEETARVSNESSPLIAKVQVAPRTTFAVARVQQEFGRNASTASAMVTSLNRDVSPGDPLAQFLVRNAFAIAGDSTLRLKGGQFEITSYGAATLLQGDPAAVARAQRTSGHYAQRPDRDYAKYDPTRTSMPGYKAGAIARRTGGTHWIWNLTSDFESPGLETNDIGRINSADGMSIRPDLRYRETVPGRIFRGYWIGANANHERNYGGNHVVASNQIYTNQTWRNFWTTQVTYTVQGRTDDARLTRGGPLMQGASRWTTNAQLRGRQVGQTVWTTQTTIGSTEDGGVTRQFVGHLSVRPGPRWQLSVDPTLLKQIDAQQYIATLPNGRPETYGQRYVFGRVDRNTYSMQIRVGYTFKPDVNLDVYAEPFAASGRYSDIGELAKPGTRQRLLYGTGGTTVVQQQDGTLVVTDGARSFKIPDNDFKVHSFRSNVVLRWEYRPGSTLYLVWQQNRQRTQVVADRVNLFDPFRSLTTPGTNYFIIKTSFWLPI